MSTICFASVRNRPGTSTVWLLTAIALRAGGREVLAVESDPDGNDLATTYELGQNPGLVSLAAAARRGSLPARSADEHARHLPDGLLVIPGPVSGEEAAAAVGSISGRLASLAATDGRVWCVDAGRLTLTSPALPAASAAAITVLVCRPERTEALALPARVAALTAAGCRLGLVTVGAAPYRPHEIAEHAGIDLLGTFPTVRDPDDMVAAAVAGRRGRRSLLWRSAVDLAAAITDRVVDLGGDPNADDNPTGAATGDRAQPEPVLAEARSLP